MPTYSTSVNDFITVNDFAYFNGTALSLTVYSGIQPTADLIQNNWGSYNSSNSIALAHYPSFLASGFSTNGTISLPYNNQNSGGQQVTCPANYYFTNAASTVVSPVTAIHTGTASWAVIWVGGLTGPQFSAPVLANNKFYVVPVTDTSETGIIRFTTATINIVGGTSVSPYDGGLSYSLL